MGFEFLINDKGTRAKEGRIMILWELTPESVRGE